MKLVVLESVHAILNIRMLELECFYHLLRCHLVGFIFVFAWCCLDGVNTFRSFTCVHLVNYRAVHVRYNFIIGLTVWPFFALIEVSGGSTLVVSID
jgi:hypothetical protein